MPASAVGEDGSGEQAPALRPPPASELAAALALGDYERAAEESTGDGRCGAGRLIERCNHTGSHLDVDAAVALVRLEDEHDHAPHLDGPAQLLAASLRLEGVRRCETV